MTEEQIRAFLMEYTETVGNAEKEMRTGNRRKAHELYAKADGMRKALDIIGCTEEVRQFYADMCEARETMIEEIEERQHASGMYAQQDLIDMYRRER
jgi:hypothetical protein